LEDNLNKNAIVDAWMEDNLKNFVHLLEDNPNENNESINK